MDDHYLEAKQLLIKAANLVHPDPNCPLALTCDASRDSIGGVLEEFQEGMWKPVRYFSKHLPPDKRKWTTYRREVYAIQQSIRHFIEEIDGRELICFTDHRPICSAFKSTTVHHDVVAQNQLQEISLWTQDIRFLAGKVNSVADCLSRPADVPMGAAYRLDHLDAVSAGNDFINFDMDAENLGVFPHQDDQDGQVRHYEHHDPGGEAQGEHDTPRAADAQPLDVNLQISNARSNQLSALNTVALDIINHQELQKSQADCPIVRDHRAGKHPEGLNLVDHEFSPNVVLYCDISDGKKARPVVPKQWHDVIFRMFHCLSHPGFKPTLKKIAARYYWPTMRKDIARLVESCPDCQPVKTCRTITPPLSHRPVIAQRFQDVMLDVVGPLPVSYGMRYLLTVIDRTSRFGDAIPMAVATAESCAEAFLAQWISRFGLPTTATSDNGNTFVNQLWQSINENLGILVSYTPLYSPASLGSLERQHRDLKVGLRATLHRMGDQGGSEWLRMLPWVLLGRRTAYQPELDTCSAEMVLGQTPRVPGDLAGADLALDSDLPSLLERLRTRAAQPPVQTAHHGERKVYMPAITDTTTHVYVKRGKVAPLGVKWDGPFKIIERIGKSSLKVRVASYANGLPRYETHHWMNCKPAYFIAEPQEAEKPRRGRKRVENSLAT